MPPITNAEVDTARTAYIAKLTTAKNAASWPNLTLPTDDNSIAIMEGEPNFKNFLATPEGAAALGADTERKNYHQARLGFDLQTQATQIINEIGTKTVTTDDSTKEWETNPDHLAKLVNDTKNSALALALDAKNLDDFNKAKKDLDDFNTAEATRKGISGSFMPAAAASQDPDPAGGPSATTTAAQEMEKKYPPYEDWFTDNIFKSLFNVLASDEMSITRLHVQRVLVLVPSVILQSSWKLAVGNYHRLMQFTASTEQSKEYHKERADVSFRQAKYDSDGTLLSVYHAASLPVAMLVSAARAIRGNDTLQGWQGAGDRYAELKDCSNMSFLSQFLPVNKLITNTPESLYHLAAGAFKRVFVSKDAAAESFDKSRDADGSALALLNGIRLAGTFIALGLPALVSTSARAQISSSYKDFAKSLDSSAYKDFVLLLDPTKGRELKNGLGVHEKQSLGFKSELGTDGLAKFSGEFTTAAVEKGFTSTAHGLFASLYQKTGLAQSATPAKTPVTPPAVTLGAGSPANPTITVTSALDINARIEALYWPPPTPATNMSQRNLTEAAREAQARNAVLTEMPKAYAGTDQTHTGKLLHTAYTDFSRDVTNDGFKKALVLAEDSHAQALAVTKGVAPPIARSSA